MNCSKREKEIEKIENDIFSPISCIPVFLRVLTSRLIENKAWINLFTALIQRISFEDLGSLRTIHPVRWISHCLVASNFFKMV